MTDYIIWQDKEILFDISKNQTELIKGEILLSQQDHIEDSKGNPGETGTLSLTNLRLIWYQRSDPRINLSIGYDCVISIEVKSQYSQANGQQQILTFKAKHKQSKFEFIFKSLIGDSPKIFSQFDSIHKSFNNTKIYRDMKSRGGDILKDKNLIILQQENIINKYMNVQNVAGGDQQSQKGILYYTNVRLVWFSLQNESFNISIPWIQIKSIDKKKLKAGPSLIIETLQSSGGYIVGYQLENLENVAIEGQKLLQFYQKNPILGVENEEFFSKNLQSKRPIPQIDDDIEIVDVGYNQRSAFSSYQTSAQIKSNEQPEIIFCKQLGLAMEKLQEGQNIDDLWKIIKISK